MKAPKRFIDAAIKRKATFPGSEILNCDWPRMSPVGKEEDECRENCLGPLHHKLMEYAHDEAISVQTRKGRQFSFRTNAYTQSYTLSFTHSH
jgi:hypothetical protein